MGAFLGHRGPRVVRLQVKSSQIKSSQVRSSRYWLVPFFLCWLCSTVQYSAEQSRAASPSIAISHCIASRRRLHHHFASPCPFSSFHLTEPNLPQPIPSHLS